MQTVSEASVVLVRENVVYATVIEQVLQEGVGETRSASGSTAAISTKRDAIKRWNGQTGFLRARYTYFLYAQKYIVENIGLIRVLLQPPSFRGHQRETHAELSYRARHQVLLETQCLAS